MRYELVEPGPRWEAAIRYLGLETGHGAGAALPDLAEILLAVVEKLQQVEARLDAQAGSHS
jgi:hypothetical protein